MNRADLLRKELSNLYAIDKQINHYFNGSDISFLNETTQLALVKYIKLSCQHEEQTSAALHSLGFNPANTTDSIVQEITENLNDIANQNIDEEVKALGYRMSINRLISYQIANIENIQHLGILEEQVRDLPEIGDDLYRIKQDLFM